ncbi:SDR family NAD(P)-dependent oxidoreductase [Thalassotalea sp. LPB0316]|uniref:SDR family NAD(P)-dependent oxidoreductase n=1 Tax=Thalassotalea sp. LPB0316 TaxID=2769490 RepID=UPI0018661F53|nr:SDR family NAD(P)-dependent oxidoreductase [Thalassotalea sp. LPB0316]QOL26007.1 SDR family NAD(P)-dependent oxidoreductase [Thalassotalea sp. LPB0316]
MSVAIIGCGWLGKALAKTLQADGIDVLGTCQSEASTKALTELSISAMPLSLPLVAPLTGPHLAKLTKHSTWIIAITPQLRKGRVDYPEKIAQLVELAVKCQIRRLILVSSTAVLNGLTGAVDEQAVIDESAPKVAILSEAEQLVLTQNNQQMQTAVLRLAGLVGEDRHPGRFFRAGKSYSQGKAPVNLIHQCDAVGLLKALVNVEVISGIYHGVSETDVTKAEFYAQAAIALGQPTPSFIVTERDQRQKRIVGRNTCQRLDYEFQEPDLVLWLKRSANG